MDRSPALLPRPRTFERRPGRFRPPAEPTLFVHGVDLENRVARRAREWFAAGAAATAETATYRLEIGVRPSADPAQDESYRLQVGAEQVRVEAAGELGALRALTTLRQLGVPGPCALVEDRPAFAWRGLLLDSCRHFQPVEQVLGVVDRIAEHKLNRLHWHLTEDQGSRIEVPGLPKLTEVAAWRRAPDGSRYGGTYSRADLRRVVEHAHGLGVEVVPEVECPGHCVATLAAYPELSCTGGPFEVETRWGIFDDVYCAGREETFAFLERVWDEVLSIFPFPIVHLGGDEVPRTRWESCPRCRERMRKEGLSNLDELQSWFVRRVGRFLESRGRRFVGWDEILDGGLAPGAIVQSWRGMEGATAALLAGHETIVSPTTHCYLDYGVDRIDLAQAFTFDPVPAGVTAATGGRVLGGEGNLWTERAPPERVDRQLYPRLCAIAERLWSGTDGSYEEFLPRLRTHAARLRAAGVDVGPESVAEEAGRAEERS